MTSPRSVADLRREYARARLDERDVSHDPLVEFARWFAEAQEAQLPEPNAMTLATATAGGAPSARIVLLKAFDQRGFVFFTDYRSRKGTELEENPRAALVFYWGELERQVRITGAVTRTSPEESQEYFITPEPGDRRTRGARGGSSGDRGSVRCRGGAAAAALGRIPGGAGRDRVLAGPGEPAARPDPVRPPA
jgi:pyridoxamine 5'-phosphate oxidase